MDFPFFNFLLNNESTLVKNSRSTELTEQNRGRRRLHRRLDKAPYNVVYYA